LILIDTQTITESFENGTDIEELLSSLKQKISGLEDSTLGSNTGQSHLDVIKETIQEIEKDCDQASQSNLPGIDTGLTILNRAMGGWRNTNFIIVAAHSGVGKNFTCSSLCHQTSTESNMG
jgi:replicative DNA helicase